MLRIYTGREDIDKQRYMFARIRRQDLDAGRKRTILLIVPDQFTLETERAAFTYMDVPAFVNPIVLSMNRLAGKVLAEAGESAEYIDRYGNYMLLARLLYRNKDSLTLYRKLENSTIFIAQLSDAIMSLKSHLVTPEDLAACADTAKQGKAGGMLLGKKLRDIAALYAGYEAALADGPPDSADITKLFLKRIPDSRLLENAIVWIAGFDYFSPLHQLAVGAMAARAAEVNVVLTAEPRDAFFALTNGMIQKLEKAAAAAGALTSVLSIKEDAAKRGIDCGYLPEDEKPPEIAFVERELFAAGPGSVSFDFGAARSGSGSPLRFVVAQNDYAEAEAAAQAILRLVREEGMRYRDIFVVCNDQDRRAATARRVFGEYGIETFIDKRRDAGYNPVLAYITALPEILARGRRAGDVLRWIGSGLTDICEEDAEELENYIERYGLQGSAWQRPLTRGSDAYDEQSFARIADTVKYVGGMISLFSKRFGAGTARARTDGLKTFLEEDARLPEKVAAYADRLEAEGFLEYAAHMRGVWDIALDIFAQIGAALGDTRTSAEEYATVLRVGFASVLMGVLPASSDAVTVGTMQRTRTGRVKALFVLGANDGELPMFAEDEGLLDDAEKERLEELGLTAFRREENLHEEERLAIYKNLSKPTRLLWVSYTAFSADGKNDTKPSRILGRLRALFPDTPLEKAGGTDEAKKGETQGASPFVSVDGKLSGEQMQALIPPVLSPTAIEKYSHCPFSFLMNYGLKLGEIRKYKIDNRGMGDVYHEVLRRFGETMTGQSGAPSDENNARDMAGRADTDATVEKIFQKIAEETQGTSPFVSSRISSEGALLFDADDPAAVYRLARLRSIAKDVCWVLTERARENGAERMMFETAFGQGGAFDMVRVGDGISGEYPDAHKGTNGLGIAGRIDRLDIMPDGRAKVLDYKSGADKWSPADIKSGWQLQLMIYLKAIEKVYEPAGVSYFRIFEPSLNLSDAKAPGDPDRIRAEVLNQYKSDGVSVGELPEDGKAKTASGEKVLSKEDFDGLRAEVNDRLAEIAAGLAEGRVPAAPKQKAGGDRVTACTWCNYKSICNYEP